MFCISSLKAPQPPDVSLFPQIIGDTFAVAIVGYAINISLGKTFGLKYGYKVDSNQVSNTNITLPDRSGGQKRWYLQTAAIVILRICSCLNKSDQSRFGLRLDFGVHLLTLNHECHIGGNSSHDQTIVSLTFDSTLANNIWSFPRLQSWQWSIHS